MTSHRPPFLILLLHAGKDADLCAELRTHLSVAVRPRNARIWDRSDIKPGERSADAVTRHLAEASLVVVLVSADYLHDHHDELETALSVCRQSGKRLVPVLARPCQWQKTALGTLEPLPKTRRAVTAHPDRDEAWDAVVTEITPLLESLPDAPSSTPTERADTAVSPATPAESMIDPVPVLASSPPPAPAKPEPQFEISAGFSIQKMYRDSLGHTYRHDYLGTVRLSNRGVEVLRVWGIEVEFPAFLVRPGNKAWEVRDENVRRRLTSDDRPEPVYPGESVELAFVYMMNDEIYRTAKRQLQRPFHIRAFIDDRLVGQHSIPLEKMQNF